MLILYLCSESCSCRLFLLYQVQMKRRLDSVSRLIWLTDLCRCLLFRSSVQGLVCRQQECTNSEKANYNAGTGHAVIFQIWNAQGIVKIAFGLP